MKNTKHTPLTLGDANGFNACFVYEDGLPIAQVYGISNNKSVEELNHRDSKGLEKANRIIRCVNLHDELLSALKESESDFALYENDPRYPAKNSTLKTIRAAIAKAEESQ